MDLGFAGSTAVVTGVDGRRRTGDHVTRTLLAVCAAAPAVPMVLAVLWAAAQHWPAPAFDIAAMARIHGTVNFVGFVVCGLLGYRRLEVTTALEAAPCW